MEPQTSSSPNAPPLVPTSFTIHGIARFACLTIGAVLLAYLLADRLLDWLHWPTQTAMLFMPFAAIPIFAAMCTKY